MVQKANNEVRHTYTELRGSILSSLSNQKIIMKDQHTEGPWMYSRTAGDHQFAVHTEKQGSDIAMVYNRNGKSEADAKLIAAAPELLKACQSARLDIMAFREIHKGNTAVQSEINHALLKIEQAILKAQEG